MNPQRVFGPYDPPRTQFVDVLRYWADQKPNDDAYIFTDGDSYEERLTYGELWRRVRGLAGGLQQRELAGARVLLLYPPGLDFVIGFFACHAAGAVAVPAFPPRRNRKSTRIRWMAQDADASFALTNRTTYHNLVLNPEAQDDLRGMELIIADDPANDRRENWYSPDLSADHLAVLQYTSGSTGNPKGVMLTHGNLIANCELINRAFCPTPYSVGMTWLPTYHDMGLVGGILQPMFIGRPNVLMSPMTFLQRPIRWLQAITRYRVTISGGPNFAYQLCVDKVTDEEMTGLNLRHWATAFNGAEPVRASTIANFSRRFASVGFSRSSFLPCYGMAETTLIVTGGPAHDPPVIRSFARSELDRGVVRPVAEQQLDARPLVGCGEVLENEKVLVVDRDTRAEIAEDRVGEIWVQSRSVGQGYWKDAERTAEVFGATTAGGDGKWLRTGDLGFFHRGQLYVTGRVKDMIIIRGVNRYPEDIELTVERHSAAVQAGAVAAFAAESEDRERLIIVAETVRRRDLDWHAEIAAIRRAVTAQHDLPPDAVYLVRPSSVPKTSSGKIQRHACQRDFNSGQLKVVASWDASTHKTQPQSARRWTDLGQTPDSTIVETVYDAIRSIAKERAATLELSTSIVMDLGLDSLERMQIAHRLEESFGARFPEEVLQEIETVREIAVAIEDHLAGSDAAAARARQRSQHPRRSPGDIPAVRVEPEYAFEQIPEYKQLQKIKQLYQQGGGFDPYFTVHEGTVRDTTKIDGREFISFASYNYLGMSGDPAVSAAAKHAIDQYGTSVSASRLVSGEKPLHLELERELAQFLGTEDALTFVGGHSTNESVIGHLIGPKDLVLHDALSHNSIIQGALLSGAARRAFPHNDLRALDSVLTQLRSQYRRVLIVVEGVYSMDGDYPDLTRLIEIKTRHRCWLMVDEAHSLGTMGTTGRGIGEHFGSKAGDVDIWMATLSKSLGSCGGMIAGSAALVEYLRYTAPGFVYSVGMPPAAAAAALSSLRVLRAEPERVQRLQQKSARFLEALKRLGFNTGLAMPGVPIVPLITGTSLGALQLSKALIAKGINVQPILHPAVEESAARLRFFVTACHSEKQLTHTADALRETAQQIGLPRIEYQRSAADRSMLERTG